VTGVEREANGEGLLSGETHTHRKRQRGVGGNYRSECIEGGSRRRDGGEKLIDIFIIMHRVMHHSKSTRFFCSSENPDFFKDICD
jgi:hypothetical protein